jgi:hypothetical protein
MSARRDVAAAAAFVAAMLAFVYGIANPDSLPDTDVVTAVVLSALAALHFGTGLAGGRWWLLGLPVVAVLLSIPAGYPETAEGEPLPIWFGLSIIEIIGFPLIAIGVVAHKLAARHRAAR